MKTSNYILSALFIFITVSLLVLFISAIDHKYKPTLSCEIHSPNSINIIIVEDCASDIKIQTSNKSSLSINWPKDENEPVNFYSIQNDTLFIFGQICQSQNISINDISVERLTSVIAKNNQCINFQHFNSDTTLHINTVNSKIKLKNSSIKEVVIHADKSNIYTHNTIFSSLSVELNNKSIYNGNLISIKKINLKTDKNSKIILPE